MSSQIQAILSLLEPKGAFQLLGALEGKRFYIWEDASSGKIWEINEYKITKGSSVKTASKAGLELTNGIFVLVVAGDLVLPTQRNTPDKMAWTRSFDNLDGFRRALRFQGELDSQGQLIMPVLPNEGWA